MIQSSIFQASADPAFAIRSFAQFTEERSRQFATMIEALAHCAEAETLEEAYSFISSATTVSLDSEVHIGRGRLLTLRDLVSQIFNGINAYADEEGELDFPIIVSTPSREDSSITFPDVLEYLRNQLYSCTALSAACWAQSQPDYASKVQNFKDRLSTVFATSSEYVQNVGQYYINLFTSNINDISFLNNVKSFLQVDEQGSASTSAEVVSIIDSSPTTGYTGCSPSSVLNVTSVATALAAPFKIGAQVVKGIFTSLGKLLKKAFGWIKKKLVQTVTDPDDMFLTEQGKRPNFDNLHWVNRQYGLFNPVFLSSVSPIFTRAGVTPEEFDDVCSAYRNKLIKCEFIFMDLIFRILDRTVLESGEIRWSIEFASRPNLLNPSSWNQSWSDVPDNWESVVSSYLTNIVQSNPYGDIKLSEQERAQGFKTATEKGQFLQSLGLLEMQNSMSGGSIQPDTYLFNLTAPSAPSTVTNADFMYAATGFGTSEYFGNAFLSMRPLNIIGAFILARIDKMRNPYDYVWFPYIEANEDLSPGMYGIKTDQQNIDAFNSFLSVAVVAVVVVAAAIVLGVTAKAISNKLYWMRQRTVSAVSKKMWEGQQISFVEKVLYKRSTRKLTAVSVITKGLTGDVFGGVAASISNQSDISNTLETLYSIITGVTPV